MEGQPPDDRRVELKRRRAAARRSLLLRRVVAVGVAAVGTIAVWFLLFQGGDEESAAERGHPSGVSDPVAHLVERLTPAERVDQLLLLGFDGTDAGASMVRELRTRQLGGVLVGPRNWVDASQGAALVGTLRAAGIEGERISPLLAVQQEGGPSRALPDLPPAERELDVGESGDPATAEAWAREGGAALRSAGFDLNLAPVADMGGIDSAVAGRAFAGDPQTAAQMTAGALRGCAQARIACAPSHFPGLGAASQNTDDGPATVSLDAASLANRDLTAFRAAIAERAPAMVLSLAFYAAYDPVTPGALAPSVVTDLLRGELRYTGVAITDDLGAGAIKATYTVPEATVAAIAAGADMVQISAPADQRGVADALLDAVRSGQIPEERLNEAVGRVLELKRSLGLLRL